MLRSRPTLWVCMAAALSLLALSSAEARTTYTPHGGSGDITNASVCPTGEFIVGFTGRSGLWIDHVKLRCALLGPGGRLEKAHTVGGAGGSGGGVANAECDRGLIKSIVYWTTKDNRQVERISFNCFEPEFSRSAGTKGFGRNNGVRFEQFENFCPDGEAAVGLGHRWGTHLNAIGLICDTLRRK
jgi:hypothetical protein